MLLTRIAACLRRGELFALRDVDSTLINAQRGSAIVKERWSVPEVVPNARRNVQRSTSQEQLDAPKGTKCGKGQRAQIDLSAAERQGLQALALRSGRSQSALIRDAIDAFLRQHQPRERLARLRQARGLGAQRTDLPEWSALRR